METIELEPKPSPIQLFRFPSAPIPLFNRILGPIYVLWMLIYAFFGCPYLMLPGLVLLPISPRLYRMWQDFFGYTWFQVTVFFQQYLFGIKVVLSGDVSVTDSDRACLFLSNHRTRLDWLFLWNYFFLQRRLLHQKIVLKSQLKALGPFGWAMQFLRFLFLKRQLAEDAHTMREFFGAWADLDYPLQLLLFPEGTDLSPSTVQSSHQFAAKTGQPLLHQCLYPRVGALTAALQGLRGRQLDAVYDLTIAYTHKIPQSETGLLTGDLPREVHVLARRYPIAEIPSDPAELAAWTTARWHEKERRLTAFYLEGRTLTGDLRASPSPAPAARSPLHHLLCLGSFLWQVVFVALMVYIHIHSLAVVVFSLLATGFFIFVTHRHGGHDEIFESPALRRAFPSSPWTKRSIE